MRNKKIEFFDLTNMHSSAPAHKIAIALGVSLDDLIK
jgi:hypothetical protein